MGCGCAGSAKRKEATGTRQQLAGSTTERKPDQKGWYWTGPKRSKTTESTPTA